MSCPICRKPREVVRSVNFPRGPALWERRQEELPPVPWSAPSFVVLCLHARMGGVGVGGAAIINRDASE